MKLKNINNKISNDINTPNEIPYYMWDYFLKNVEVKEILNSNDEKRKIWLCSKIMRDAKYDDIWKLLDKNYVIKNFNKIINHLGHRKPIWEFLFSKWREYGYI